MTKKADSTAKIPPEFDALTPKQRDFVLAYVKEKNATQAARDAGYKGNDVTLQAVGAENLRKPLISAAIDALTKPNIEKQLVSIESVIGELAAIGFTDWEQHLSVGPFGNVKLSLKDKIAALKLLGDHVGAFKSGSDDAAVAGIQIVKQMTEQEARDWFPRRHRPMIELLHSTGIALVAILCFAFAIATDLIIKQNEAHQRCSLGHLHVVYRLQWRRVYVSVLQLFEKHGPMTTAQVGNLFTGELGRRSG